MMYDLMSRDGVKYIIGRVIENADEAMEERKKNPESEYYAGMVQAFYETLDIIKNELIVRGENLAEYSLDRNLEESFH